MILHLLISILLYITCVLSTEDINAEKLKLRKKIFYKDDDWLATEELHAEQREDEDEEEEQEQERDDGAHAAQQRDDEVSQRRPVPSVTQHLRT